MGEQYTAKCFGYRDSDGTLVVAEHEFPADHEVFKGSHSLCPRCIQLYNNQTHINDNETRGLENAVGNA